MGQATAAVLVEPGRVEVWHVPLPSVDGDGGILLIEACGVCGSDLGTFRHGPSPHQEALPLALGHELVGRVAALGDAAACRWGVEPGDRVVIEEHVPCGACPLCRSGRSRLCFSQLRYGSRSARAEPGLWGGFASHLYLHPRAVVHRAPDDVPAHVLSLAVPVANGLSWVQRLGGATVGSAVVVFGPGAHGLGCALAGTQAGARVLLVGRPADGNRLAAARAAGLAELTLTTDDDLVGAVAQLSGGAGADVVVDATPSNIDEPLAWVPELCAPGATIVVAGTKRGTTVNGFRPDALLRKELTVRGVWGRDDTSMERALRLLARQDMADAVAKLCSATVPVERTQEALEAMRDSAATGVVHVSVMPD